MENKNVKYYLEYNETDQIKLQKGNAKLGKKVYTFNTLPGEHALINKSTAEQLTNVLGTCTGCCQDCESGGCYAIRDAKLYHNSVIPSQGKNTLIMRNNMDNGFKQIQEQITKLKVKTLRFHSSGEIINYDYLLKMVDLARNNPDVKFYFYTKRFAYMQKYIEENGSLPENLICNISVWKDNIKDYKLDGLNQFIWDDGSDENLSTMKHCPAVSKPVKAGGKGKETGITCSQCGLCYKANDGHKICVYNH